MYHPTPDFFRRKHESILVCLTSLIEPPGKINKYIPSITAITRSLSNYIERHGSNRQYD